MQKSQALAPTQEEKQIQIAVDKISPPSWSVGQIAHLEFGIDKDSNFGLQHCQYNYKKTIQIDEVEYELENYRQALKPAEDKSIAVFLANIVNHFGAPENWADLTEDYFIALEDLPEYHLQETYKSILKNCKWFPKIAEIRANIPDTFHRQKNTYSKIKLIHRQFKERNKCIE